MGMLLVVFNVKAESKGYAEWLKKKNALKQDSNVVRYYTFEDVTDSKSIVKDLISFQPTLYH